MTTPPITCAEWCADGTGHTNELCAADQECHSREHSTPLRLMPNSPPVTWSALTVSAIRPYIGAPAVVLEVHILESKADDIDTRLTASEAREVAAYLAGCADLIDRAAATPSQGGPT